MLETFKVLDESFEQYLMLVKALKPEKYDEMVTMKTQMSTLEWMRLSLVRLISEFAEFQPTDPRDKVFALPGLTTDGSQEALKSDFSE